MAGITATYVSPSGFTITTDRTNEFLIDRRVKADCSVDGFKFGTITSSSYASGGNLTTVNLTSASDNLTSNLTDVYYGIISEGHSGSVPVHNHNGDEGSGGIVTGSSYLHSQPTTATSWIVAHNLNFQYPNVEVISANKSLAGTYNEPEIAYDSTTQLTCTFTIGTSGYCYCVGGS